MPHQSLTEDRDGNMNPELQRRDGYLLHSTPVPITHWHNLILVPVREKLWPRNSKWYLVAFSHSLSGLVSVIKYSCLYFLVTKKWKHHSFGQIDHYKNIINYSAVHAEMVSLITESCYQTNLTNMYIHIHSSYSTEWKINILIKHFFWKPQIH